MRLGVDIDGVLANFNLAYAKLLTNQTGITFPTTSPDWPAVWNYDRAAGITPEQEKTAWKTIMEDDTFWLNLKPYPEAQVVTTQLNHLTKLGHECFFLTNRMGNRAKVQTERFLYGIGSDYPCVILVADKTPLIRLLGLNFFIDDKLDTVNEVARVAEEEKLPVHGHTYLLAAPYNRQGRREDLKVVDSVIDALKQEDLWS